MYDAPVSLQNCCVDYICENIEALCEVQTNVDDNQYKLVFKDPDIFFHNNISEQLLQTLCDKGKLDDLTLRLFDPKVTRLKSVAIKDAPVTTKGLRVLKAHKIQELEAIGLKNVTINDLIGCLGEWTLQNLRTLNVTNSTFLNSAKFCVVVSLSKLRSLHSLNVSNTEFNKHGLEMIADDLPVLESLDISCTPVSDITPLRKCKSRLKSLFMYNLRASHNEDIVPVLCELCHLRCLDVSDDYSVQTFFNLQPVKFRADDLLKRKLCLPHLSYLDLSGKEGITDILLRDFLETHVAINFLGLALTGACDLPIFIDEDSPAYRSDITVTGEGNEKQILEALRRYNNRAVYVQKSLYNLFGLTQRMSEPRVDIIEYVMPGMKTHPKQLGVQMAATACLYNLTKGELGQKIPPTWLSKVVGLTLDAMENFPNHQQLQKNTLLTLCSDRILQDVHFDRYRCARLVMECLCSFEDQSMNRMSVAICSILAAKISTDQTSQLGAKPNYMKKLLTIVKLKMEGLDVDITMKFTLSALWNLTDESPTTCDMFLSEGGLEVFIDVLTAYSGLQPDMKAQVETKVLGLINNIAEVKKLRPHLMRRDVIIHLRELLRSAKIDVSYFAAGIFAHIASDGPAAWTVPEPSRQDILTDLALAVLNWEQPQGEMVAYRSFTPFFPLLACHENPEVQLWAVWAMQHVCIKNGQRYCPMLVEEGGQEKIYQLAHDANAHSDVKRIAGTILSHLLASSNPPEEQA